MLILIPVIVIHLALDILYRPLAYRHSFQDFGFRDSFTQITAVIGISLLMVILEREDAWDGRVGRLFLIIIPVIAMVVYEFIQLSISTLRFDPQDLLYTLIGGIVAGFIQFKIIK